LKNTVGEIGARWHKMQVGIVFCLCIYGESMKKLQNISFIT